MSVDGADLDAPKSALALIAAGINGALAELNELGMVGEAAAGRGFSSLALSGLQLGHAGLTAEFETYCERWEWGVRTLMLRGNNFAAGVGLAAGSIHEQERYVKDSLKVVVNGLNGNPHLTEDEIKQKSWAEISTQQATDNADWSAESFTKAGDEIKTTWQNTGYDVMATNADRMEQTGLIDEGQRDAARSKLHDLFEPTPEAVAQQRGEEPAQQGTGTGQQSGGNG